MIKKGISILLVIVILATPLTVQAKTVTRYVTPAKVSLKTATKNGKTAYTVKRNTKLSVTAEWKVWARVRYKNRNLYVKRKWLSTVNSPKKYAGSVLRRSGVIRWRGKKYTWYTQRILPGRGLKIPGRHLDKQGFVCDKWGYIVLASHTLNRGKIISTPFGKFGKVYDAGGGGTSWFDVYTNW